ncbi:MAG: bifunctional 2-C-methyl-D-erythritol 4-phosphate cytidylyltransferase/2-C-methyl-D-erythritol 2,4-cyclodiphosphate synthase [Pseudomonadota bacterium]
MPQIAALIVAAGRGSRFGKALPKQYATLGGVPVLRRTVTRFLTHPMISRVCVAIHPQDRDFYEAATQGLDLAPPVLGGASRQESVRLGLEGLAAAQPDFVLIHDGARPLVDCPTIDRVIDALATSPGAIAALPVHDSLKLEASGNIAESVSRDGLWRAQTPQGFHFNSIIKAHHEYRNRDDFTDDAAIATANGLTVTLIEGNMENIKITDPSDLKIAESFLDDRQAEEIRTGQGFDVHRFEPGDAITLCGVTLPHSQKLKGHSDADVGLHALTDALLGALGAGDIGQHFPPSDPKWAGADSAQFLSHAAALAQEAKARIVNLDVTLICERPKIGPHRQKMTERIAQILEIGQSRVSVKATTTEGLGFTGRREGIAAQAIVTLALHPAAAAEKV